MRIFVGTLAFHHREGLRTNPQITRKPDNDGTTWVRVSEIQKHQKGPGSRLNITEFTTIVDGIMGATHAEATQENIRKANAHNVRFRQLFFSDWELLITDLLRFPAYRNAFALSTFDDVKTCRFRAVGNITKLKQHLKRLTPRQFWVIRLRAMSRMCSELVSDQFEWLDYESLKILSTDLKAPRTTASVGLVFDRKSTKDLRAITGNDVDRGRHPQLFSKLDAVGYRACRTWLEENTYYTFILWSQIATISKKHGKIANDIAVHIASWLRPDCYDGETRGQRIIADGIWRRFPCIGDDPRHIHDPENPDVPVPAMTHDLFEDDLASLISGVMFLRDIESQANQRFLLPLSLEDGNYRERFQQCHAWMQLYTIVSETFGVPAMVHPGVAGDIDMVRSLLIFSIHYCRRL